MPALSEPTDHDLASAIWRGDTAALDLLFMRHHERLYSFLARWTGNPQEAEDLVQELFLKLLRPRGHIKGEVLPWLFLVARNMAVDRHRQRQVVDPMEFDAGIRDERPLALERLTSEERTAAVDAVLAELPQHHREVLLLRGVEGLGHRDIGLVINCSEGAARVRLHRATAAFRQIWQARHGEEA